MGYHRAGHPTTQVWAALCNSQGAAAVALLHTGTGGWCFHFVCVCVYMCVLSAVDAARVLPLPMQMLFFCSHMKTHTHTHARARLCSLPQVMKRHENCHAYVNSAILISLDDSNTGQCVGSCTKVFVCVCLCVCVFVCVCVCLCVCL